METLSVRCNHCGAPLQVAEATRFVTCQFCQSSLEVKRMESSLFTEEVAKIAESLEAIQLQNEIERLDREHPQEHASIFNIPHSQALWSWIMLVVVVLSILFGSVFLNSSGQKAGPGLILFGAIIMVSGIVVLGRWAMRFVSRNAAASDYFQHRAELQQKLQKLTRD